MLSKGNGFLQIRLPGGERVNRRTKECEVVDEEELDSATAQAAADKVAIEHNMSLNIGIQW